MYESGIGDVLPAGMRTPRLHHVRGEMGTTLACGGSSSRSAPAPWDLDDYRRAAFLLGRLAARRRGRRRRQPAPAADMQAGASLRIAAALLHRAAGLAWRTAGPARGAGLGASLRHGRAAPVRRYGPAGRHAGTGRAAARGARHAGPAAADVRARRCQPAKPPAACGRTRHRDRHRLGVRHPAACRVRPRPAAGRTGARGGLPPPPCPISTRRSSPPTWRGWRPKTTGRSRRRFASDTWGPSPPVQRCRRCRSNCCPARRPRMQKPSSCAACS